LIVCCYFWKNKGHGHELVRISHVCLFSGIVEALLIECWCVMQVTFGWTSMTHCTLCWGPFIVGKFNNHLTDIQNCMCIFVCLWS